MSVKDLHPALFAFLTADAAIAAAVNAGSGKYHVYPNVLPQGFKGTAVAYQEISGLGDYSNVGPSGLARSRLQLTAWAVTPGAARALALLIKDRIDGYAGAMGSGASEVTVQGVFFQDWRDLYDGTLQLHGKSADYFTWYEER